MLTKPIHAWVLLIVCVHRNFLIVSGAEGDSNKDCVITLSRRFIDDRAPLFLHYTPIANSTSQFFLPETKQEIPSKRVNYLRIPSDESVMLACPGNGNQILGLNRRPAEESTVEPKQAAENKPSPSVSSMQCHDKIFSFQHKRVDIQKLICKTSMDVNVEKRGQCGPDGEANVYKIGFKVEHIDETIMEACFDPISFTTLYTNHTLRGPTLKSAVQTKLQRGYKNVEAMYGTVNPEYLYKPKTQRKTLLSNLKDDRFRQYFESHKLSRTQLVPRKDFPLKAWRRATDLYPNVVPVWNNIKMGHWTRLEINIRRVAMERNLNFHIITGILNDIKPESETASPGPGYLDPTQKHIIVPDFIYKIVIDSSSNTGIAFIADNNPLNTAGLMCKTDICSDNQWPSYKQRYNGIIYCCAVSEILALVPGAPKVTHVQGVLKGSDTLFTEPSVLLENIEEALA